MVDNRASVTFGERDGIKVSPFNRDAHLNELQVGHCVVAVNGQQVKHNARLNVGDKDYNVIEVGDF